MLRLVGLRSTRLLAPRCSSTSVFSTTTHPSSIVSVQSVRSFHGSFFLLESHVVNVPSMGDSITEGTVVSWMKDVGDHVEKGEAVCVIDTDKVSVDVQSDESGTITELFAEPDSNIDVGAPLLKLDLSGTGAAPASDQSASAPAAPTTPSTPPAAPSSSTSAIAASGGARVPLIKFLGKRALLHKDQHDTTTPGATSTPPVNTASVPVSSSPDDKPTTPGALSFFDTPTMYRRLSMEEEEMDMVDMGGAV